MRCLLASGETAAVAEGRMIGRGGCQGQGAAGQEAAALLACLLACLLVGSSGGMVRSALHAATVESARRVLGSRRMRVRY